MSHITDFLYMYLEPKDILEGNTKAKGKHHIALFCYFSLSTMSAI